MTTLVNEVILFFAIAACLTTAYGLYCEWNERPTRPADKTKMKVQFCDLKKGDEFADGEIVEFMRSYDGNTHLVFESGKRFVISDSMLITITRSEV